GAKKSICQKNRKEEFIYYHAVFSSSVYTFSWTLTCGALRKAYAKRTERKSLFITTLFFHHLLIPFLGRLPAGR
ncbi:MAG: hypothetical protein KC550_07670, partial [Nanoarchaeota archaeon]|nr:hypothetical protein [Nanoarchaeota archaeon]